MIDVLGGWGACWAFGDPRPSELDPIILLWWMRRRVHRHRLPARRVVIQFDFRGAQTGSYWLILEWADVSVWLQHLTFAIDVYVRADMAAFPHWFAWSPMADAVRGGLARPALAPARASG